MQPFRNILVVADHKTPGAALRRAMEQTNTNDGRVTVVDVIPDRARGTTKDDQWLQDLVIQEREKTLRQLVSQIAKEGVAVKVLLGNPFVEIIREVLRNGHDLVLKIAEGAGKRRESLMGSTDAHLVRKCPCPVWIVASPRSRRISRVMAAVDADPTDATRMALDREIIQFASGLAGRENSELHVVHAWSLFGEEVLRGRSMSATSKLALARMLKEARNEAEIALAEIVRSFSGGDVKAHLHLIKGRAEKVVASAVAKHRIGLLVIGTVGRTGIPGFLIGNTAEKVLGQVDCSIVALKPDGFVSPVEL